MKTIHAYPPFEIRPTVCDQYIMTFRFECLCCKLSCSLPLSRIKVLFVLVTIVMSVYVMGMLGAMFYRATALVSTGANGSVLSRFILDLPGGWRINELFLRRDRFTFRNYMRNTSCTRCFEHNFEYILQNEHICRKQSPEQDIDLLIVVLTQHENWRARHALRKTWLSLTKNNTSNVRHAFLLGEVRNDRQRKAILKENRLYHDIIKEDFLDSYMNLTYKTIMGLKFATKFCKHASYVLKADDDVFINVPKVLSMLQTNGSMLRYAVGGACTAEAEPIRNTYSKWYASWESYPGERYPDFCSGTAYITSANIARALFDVSPDVPYFHLEDVYVGLCLAKLGYHVKYIPGFLVDDLAFVLCDYKRDDVYTAHEISPLVMYSIWNKKC